MSKNLGVGVIGASAERGWARDSHVPAVQRLAGLELVAVASGSQTKSDDAAKAFGAKKGFGRGEDLIHDPDVDIVTVAVKVPDHRELVLAAIESGKHIYCEWPLGRDLAETEEMAEAARVAGVHTAIGLQMRASAAVQRARELIVSGAIGRVLSAHCESNTVAFGPKVEAAMAFGEQAENGVTLVTIQGAHTFDLAIAVLGGLSDLAVLATTQYPEVEVGDDAKKEMRSTPDHVLLQARLAESGVLSVEVAGGRPPESPSRLAVVGTEGVLEIDGGAARGMQSGRLSLKFNAEALSVDEGEITGMPDAAANVAGIYRMLRDDISAGTTTAPNFQHAVRLTRLVDAVLSSARTGARTQAADWFGNERPPGP